MNNPPCILHGENRMGIKELSMLLLLEGISNVKKGKLYADIRGEGPKMKKYIVDVERIINQSILGSKDDPCHWCMPYDTTEKKLGPITMDNTRVRKIVDSLEMLIDITVVDANWKILWYSALQNYRIAMVLLRQKRDFTNDQIATFQRHADLFFQKWVELHQKEGVTNYIHMMGSGHFAEYLYKWRNLYRYSQQGWEAMNAMIKTFFYRRTNHGGSTGNKGTSQKSGLVPIARWLQRRLIFLCRFTEDEISKYIRENPITDRRTQIIAETGVDPNSDSEDEQ
jgi:hypothetical protein